MNKTIILIFACLLSCVMKAGVIGEFPSIIQFMSKDSTVWILVDEAYGLVAYRIDFDKSGKIRWSENETPELAENLWKYYVKVRYQGKDKKDYDKNGNLWEIGFGTLLCNDKEVHEIPYMGCCILHIRDNGEVWTGGIDYVGYYYNGTWRRIFVIDKYRAQSTEIKICKEKGCPEEKKLDLEDYDDTEFYDGEVVMADGYPESICFCDGRKIGCVKAPDGFVNFRTEPNISSPIIGIILDNVRVFYWDNESNDDWYRVLINETEGYVHKSKIKIQQ